MGLSADDDTTDTLGADSELVSAAFDMPNNPGIVRGRVWSDDNGNGLEDGNERGLENWKVFVDLDEDGILDPLEPTQLTDANAWQLQDRRGGGSRSCADVPGR
jgi:hypothetical protein